MTLSIVLKQGQDGPMEAEDAVQGEKKAIRL
jgi:hypothetical protein